MDVKTISTEVLINHLRDTIKDPDNKICFILGAGASVESGIDSGAMLARQWYRELPLFHSEQRIAEWKTEVNFDENNIPAFYSKLFRLRYDGHRGDGIHFITSIIEKGIPGFGYTILSQVLQRTTHNVVITTNFDTLTEESLYIFTNKRAQICNHENLAHLARPSSTRPLIVKIHRGLYMDPLNDQDEIAEIKPQWKKTLTDIFHNYIPIVLGYGGNDDSLMHYLKQIDACQRMYWCLNSDRPPRKDIIEIVDHHRGIFVSTGGFNRLMFRFIDLFELTKIHEVFEQLAKERAEKLRKEFEEAGKDISRTGTQEEKQELGKVADDFDTTDWLQWVLKANTINDNQERKAFYVKAIAALPQSNELQNNLGNVLNDLGLFDDAIAVFRKAIEIKPDFQEAWNNMAISYKNKGQFDDAIEVYKKAIEVKPDYYIAWYNMGIAYKNIGQFDEAIAAYKKTVEIKPDNHDAWYNMGNAYEYKGQFDEAITAYKKAVEIKPDNYNAWYNIGISYDTEGQFDDAIAAYKKVVELKSDNHDAWNNMGVAYKKMDEFDDAIVAYKKAVKIKPDKDNAWYNMGVVYKKMGKFNDAIVAFKKVVKIKPDKDLAWYNMGVAYEKIGDIKNTQKCYKKAYDLNPNDPYYKKKFVDFKNEEDNNN